MHRMVTGRRFLWLLMGLVLLVSCARDEGIGDRYRAEQMYYRASKLYQTLQIDQGELSSERFDRIRESFRRIIEEYPPSTLRQIDYYNDTVRQELFRITGMSQLNLADLFTREGQVDSAIAAYRMVISEYRDQRSLSSRAQYSLALVYQGADRWSEAVTAFETLLEEYPPFRETPQQPDEMILNIPGYIASTYLSRGDSAMAGQYFQKAHDFLSRVTEQWPQTPTARMAQNKIVNAYIIQEHWSSAVSALERLAAMSDKGDDPPDALFLMATLYSERLGDFHRAMGIYTDMLQRYPDSGKLGRAILAMGQIHFQKGELQEAHDAFGRVIENYPDDQAACATAQFGLALSYEFEGDWEKALNEFRWVLDNYPGSRESFAVPNHIFEHYRQYGEQELAQTAYQQALRTYSDIVTKRPGTPQALQGQWHIAQAHILMQSWEQAAAALEQLVQDFPQSQQVLPALMSLGEIYELHLGKIDQAMGAYQMVVRLAPRNPYAGIAAEHIDRLQKALP